MKVEIKIKNRTTPIIMKKVLYTKVVNSFYLIHFDKEKYMYPVHNIIAIKETLEKKDEEIKVLGEDSIKV